MKRAFWMFLVLLIAAVLTIGVHVNAQQGLRGPTTGELWIPSVFDLRFGDVTTTDILLQRNGANVLGVTGAIGGAGAVANTTTTPAGPFNWGTVAMSSNTATVTFKVPYAVAPMCVATEVTGVFAVKIAPTSTTAVITNTGGGATDTINWACFGNPN